MSDEPAARSIVSPALPAPDEYDAICAVLMQTERGRWFLQEYARRSRSADTALLLAAIRRLEGVVRAERSSQARQSFRADLLEMAKAITRTRAEVADIKPAISPPGAPGTAGGARPRGEPAERGDVLATAARIKDISWAMRGHGFDPSTCDQIDELAGSILAASSLRDPTDRRARKLSEVLHDLERRVNAMLDRCADRDADPDADRDPEGALLADPSQCSARPVAELTPSPPACEILRLPAPPSISLPAGAASRPLVKGAEPSDQAAPAPVERVAAEEAPPPPSDPLARLRALSEIERIALFT